MLPYSEFTLSDIWEAIYTNPSLLVSTQDRRIKGSSLCLPLLNGKALMSFEGHPREAIVEADLWLNDDGPPIATVDEHGPLWHTGALANPSLFNELCFPYGLTIVDNLWCIVDHRTKEIKMFRSGFKYDNLESVASDTFIRACEYVKLIGDYVDSIDVSSLPREWLCEQCQWHSGPHLLEHIVRGECSVDLLTSLVGLWANWDDKKKEMLKQVLWILAIQSKLNHAVTFACPPPLVKWTQRLGWGDMPIPGKMKFN